MKKTISRNPRPRIAWIEVIRTLSGGAQIYKAANSAMLPFEARLSTLFDITFFKSSPIFRYLGYTQSFPRRFQLSLRSAFFFLLHHYDLLVTVDIPNVEGLVPFVLAKLMRKPVLLKETHWYWHNSVKARLLWPINLWLVQSANMVIVPGKRVEKYWKQAGVNPGKLEVVPFYSSTLETSDRTTLLTEDLRRKFANKTSIIFVGRLIKTKGAEYLIEAFAKVKNGFPSTVLLIVGDGPEKHNLEKLVKSLRLDDVVFVGTVSEKDKTAYFMVADMCVFPSVWEEWGMVLTEAMSVGKPVVVTSTFGSALDAVQNGVNGYIVPERDSESLYKAIIKLVENADLRRSMGKKSKEISMRFSYDFAARKMIRAIEFVLQNRALD